MLILNRCKDEAIMIGDDIEIIVVRINQKFVRIGIKAPKVKEIHRKEVYEMLQRNKPYNTH